jgi:hypothetical protein
MKKYQALGLHLATCRDELVKFDFDRIEEVLGFQLPESARMYRAWWANDRTHVQALHGWLSSHWMVEHVDLKERFVIFKKIGGIEMETVRQVPQDKEVLQLKEIEYLDSRSFEEFARDHMGGYFGKDLAPRKKPQWAKLFDLVSADYAIVGDAKYFSMVGGERLPPAKFSVIAEHVWMLEKTDARIRFLVFGNDRRVPEEWLKRYGSLVNSVDFYFLKREGEIIPLKRSIDHNSQ